MTPLPSLRRRYPRTLLAVVVVSCTAATLAASFAQSTATPPAATTPATGPVTTAPGKTFIDFFLPLPTHDGLTKQAWGAENVMPRDPKNGLEDLTAKQYCYWDGQIIKAKDGKYHMFASRWDQSRGHRGWSGSVAVHAVSEKDITGPYIDKGLTWPDNQNGKGHNVTALTLPNDEGYAIIVSETRSTPDVFVSKSLDGPWTYKGVIQGVQNSNISMIVRPDGDFQIVPRNGHVYISKSGILGPYKDLTNATVFPQGRQFPNMEDPCLFYAGGYYQIVVNSWSTRKAYHLVSKDGITNWVNRGIAYDPTRDFVKYTDGTINHWAIMERPGMVVEDGKVTHMTLASIDVPKAQELGNDTHASKILVIPFDGAALNADLAKANIPGPATAPASAPATTPAP